MIRRLAAVVAGLAPCLLLAACAASVPPPERYLLPLPAPGPGPLPAPDTRVAVHVQDVRLADYLAGSGIVYQVAPGRVHAAARHRWANPLAAQLRRGLRDAIAAGPSGVVPVSGPGPGVHHLAVVVDSFQGRFDGTARAAGEWRLHGPDGALLVGHRFRVDVPLREDGYPALVRALSEAWEDVAAGIAAGIADVGRDD